MSNTEQSSQFSILDFATRKETVYGGPIGRKANKKWFVYLRGSRIGYGETKEEAQKLAKQTLSDAYEYITRSCVVRQAQDGTILVFRQISADSCMYEFCRNGKGGSSCIGRMTNGLETFRTMDEYADYVLGQYQS